jgi:prepilin-type N-terminal cleavage/methylation domain-containing protein
MDPQMKIRLTRHSAFTLVELLVVIAIILTLALFSIMGVSRYMEQGRKSRTLNQFRNFETGMTLYVNDYQKPPIPDSKWTFGWDTIYGDPGGKYSTQFVVSALKGDLADDEGDFIYGGETFSARAANPRNETYVAFPFAPDKKGGVGDDGKLYDPWGGEIMIAINVENSIDSELEDFDNGKNDRRMHTWGLAEYTETKPREQAYVLWSYGKDKKKGKNAPSVNSVVSLQNSDDVISW